MSQPPGARAAVRGLTAALLLVAGGSRAQGLDWQVSEPAAVPAPAAVVRNVRDGVWSLGDAVLEANTALFGEVALAAAKALMAASDTVGLLDDNVVTIHVTRAFFSKHLAKTAYFWHVAGSESLLGGHGLETERWALAEVAGWNPLLGEEDVAALEGPLPLDPLSFVGEGLFHDSVYRTHRVPLGVGALLMADGVLRPVGALLRIVQLPAAGVFFEEKGQEYFRRTTRSEW